MKHLTSIVAAMLLSTGAMSQTIHIDSDNGLIKACPEDVLTLTATATSVGDEAGDASYFWDFDNGDHRTTRIPTVEYAYKKGGAYMLSVTMQQDGKSVTDVAKVIVGKSPDFSGYSNDISKSYAGVCLGEKITLKMPIADVTVGYKSYNYYYESAPQTLYGSSWSEKVRFKCFDNATILSATDIDAVKLSFFHGNTANAQITLTAPDGKTAVLSAFDEALDGGREFIFANRKLIEYIFTPENSPEFAALVGAPINGEWKLEITSNDTENSCYVYGFEIILDDQLVKEHQWQFDAKYDLRRAVWSGKGVSATSAGVADARPQEEGTTRYSFLISDDMGCLHDTSVFVSVELASFTSVEEGGTVFIGDEINFSNKTSWAAETTWHLGDNSPLEYTADAPHAYYNRGKYEVVMETKSAKGCIDVDTQYVSIIPRPLEIKEVNVFTPNGDGVNDVFTFFNEDESFLSNGNLTQMPANIKNLRCKIYNSYGQTICKWESVTPSIFGWDGTIDNKGNRPCPPGTYFYDIVVNGKDGTTLKRSGTILLYRKK
ncbi:MAG: gliding motility-associated C-terminal domain-containing protein [Bacteroidales bacterium]|nr:gliding motility-associated C-terminal domain-containing protein [Bacteroidales bacterium]